MENKAKIKDYTIFLILTTIVLILLIVLIHIDVGAIKTIDNFMFRWIHSLRCEPLNVIMYGLSILSSPEFIIVLMITLLCFKSRKKVGIPCAFMTVIGIVLGYALKFLVARPRPVDMLVESSVINITLPSSYSFPSGHSLLSLIFGFVFLYTLLSYKNKNKNYSYFAILFSVLIGFSRIYLGVHYFTDVLAGWLLATIIIFLYMLFEKTGFFKNYFFLTRDKKVCEKNVEELNANSRKNEKEKV